MIIKMKRNKGKVMWINSLDKSLNQVIKKQQKIWNAKQKIHKKAVIARQKKVEKNIDRTLMAAGTIACFAVVLIEAMEAKKQS